MNFYVLFHNIITINKQCFFNTNNGLSLSDIYLGYSNYA